MLDFSCKIDAVIDAAPQVVFDIISDPSRHVELAGSGELNALKQDPPGQVEPGTRLHAEETLMLADGTSLNVTSDSVVVTCDPPTTFSWIVSPALPDRFRRVQWWFHLSPEGSATKVTHEVELDIGELHDPLLITLRENFDQVRGSVIRTGMEKTLETSREWSNRPAEPACGPNGLVRRRKRLAERSDKWLASRDSGYGSHMPPTAPEGTVTLLFTDIEESARLWADVPADTADAVHAHDAIVRDAIERHGGYLLATGDDSFRAAFSTAANAAAAAIDAQRQLTEDGRITFAVRMGLHTGEVVHRDEDYLGSDVNRAARLVGLAHGGQILVSETTEILLRRAVALRPLGEHRLRGLRGRMSVHQIVAAGLPTEFPVLRSVDCFNGNVPQQLSSLVGREDLVRDVAEQVRSTRLVTLSGMAGVGKTRLALEVGAELSGEFTEGAWMVELAGIGDSALVPAAIATVLGITPQGDTR